MGTSVSTKNKPSLSTNIVAWAGVVLGLIGTLIAVYPIYIERTNQPELHLRLLSYGILHDNKKNYNTYILRVSVFSLKKNFYLDDIKIYIKYPELSSEILATVMIWRNDAGSGSINLTVDGKTERRKVMIPYDKYLMNQSIFLKETSVPGFLSFTDTNHILERPEYIRYEFIDINKKSSFLETTLADMNQENKISYDVDEWAPVIQSK
ncbi:MAG: hypothetical protein ABI113_13300 [Mucilaginibacter sp.]